MKKVLTIILDESIAKEIFDEYFEFADFISMETEAEHYLKDDGWKTWDGDEAGIDFDEECDCAEDCSCEKDNWIDRRKVEI
jgi:hypothetical protein